MRRVPSPIGPLEQEGEVPDRNKNAKVIIPLAIGIWLITLLGAQSGAPPAFWPVFGIAMAFAVVFVVFYLMAEQGWSTLAQRFRSTEPFTGAWKTWPTTQMSLVSVDDPAFDKHRLRMVSTLRIAASPDALHMSLLFSRIPLLGRFFPDVRIPWSEFSSARTFEAPGWFAPQQQPGAIFQLGYDPNYRGTFAELTAGQPPVFIQMPLEAVEQGAAQLGLTQPDV
jgi:hypothetical protein